MIDPPISPSNLPKRAYVNVTTARARVFLQQALDAGFQVGLGDTVNLDKRTLFTLEGRGLIFGITYDPILFKVGITLLEKKDARLSDDYIFSVIDKQVALYKE